MARPLPISLSFAPAPVTMATLSLRERVGRDGGGLAVRDILCWGEDLGDRGIGVEILKGILFAGVGCWI